MSDERRFGIREPPPAESAFGEVYTEMVEDMWRVLVRDTPVAVWAPMAIAQRWAQRHTSPVAAHDLRVLVRELRRVRGPARLTPSD